EAPGNGWSLAGSGEAERDLRGRAEAAHRRRDVDLRLLPAARLLLPAVHEGRLPDEGQVRVRRSPVEQRWHIRLPAPVGLQLERHRYLPQGKHNLKPEARG